MTNKETIEGLKKVKSFHNGSYGTAIDMAIKALEQRWIPVSERLPEEDGKYLTTVKGRGSNYNEIRSFAISLYKIDKYDFSDKKGSGWYFYDYEYGYIEETNVIAWMPLPEPYVPDTNVGKIAESEDKE